MYKDLKYKLRQLQRSRFLLSTSLLVCFAILVSQLPEVSTHRPEKDPYIQHLEKSINRGTFFGHSELGQNSQTSVIFLDTGLENGFLPGFSQKSYVDEILPITVILDGEIQEIEVELLIEKDENTDEYFKRRVTFLIDESEANKAVEEKIMRAWLFFGISLILSLLLVIRLISQLRYSKSLHTNAYWITYLPEECVSELTVLRKRMEKQKLSPWEIRLQLMQEFLSLLWVFYVQIKLSNLRLPGSDHQIDD